MLKTLLRGLLSAGRAPRRLLVALLIIPALLVVTIAAVPALILLPFSSSGTDRVVKLLRMHITYARTLLGPENDDPPRRPPARRG